MAAPAPPSGAGPSKVAVLFGGRGKKRRPKKPMTKGKPMTRRY